MRSKLLSSVLKDLHHNENEIEASAIVSNDGLIMSSNLPKQQDEYRLGAITSALVSLAARTANDFSRGTISQILLKGDDGYFFVSKAGANAVLVVMAPATLKLGLFLHDCSDSALKIEKIL